MKLGAKGKVAIVVAVAALGVAMSTESAFAYDNTVYTTNGSGDALWVENGDTLTVCDLAADGYGVRGYIYEPNAGDPGNGTVLIKQSDPTASNGCYSLSKNVSESVKLGLKVCNYAGATIKNCAYVSIR